VNFLKEGDSVYIVMHDGKPISMRPPQSVKLKVIEADDAVKGDTATAPKKTVTVETGVTVKVPLFIKKDEIIVINPETGEYVERATN
jgi:elongation factor P